MPSSFRPTVLATLLLLAACGPSSPPTRTARRAAGPSSGAEPAVERANAPTSITALKRARVKAIVARGLGAFLHDVTLEQNLTLEDWPVMRDGRFYGFKIRTIRTDSGVDLKPGDVVTRVNGIVPEHPEEADAALRSLEKAASLKVDLEREGKTRTLELPIVD